MTIDRGNWKWTCDGCGHTETHPASLGIDGWVSIKVTPTFDLRAEYNLCPDCAKKAEAVAKRRHPFGEDHSEPKVRS